MPHEAQRCTHAHRLGRDPRSNELVHMSNLIPANMRNIHRTNDGVMFVPNTNLRSSDHGPIISAAIPSMLGRRLADVASARNISGRAVQDRVQDCLKYHRKHSVLFDILPKEEQQIRTQKGLPDWTFCSYAFKRYPQTMPRAFKAWAPEHTVVSPTPEGTAVIFKDLHQNGLIRLWFSKDKNSDNEEWIASCLKKTVLVLPTEVLCSPYAAEPSTQQQLHSLKQAVYDIHEMTTISGALIINTRDHGTRLKVSTPSRLAQLLWTEAIRAARSDSNRPERTPTERVCNAIIEFMADWGRGYTPILLNLIGAQETTSRERYGVSHMFSIEPLFAQQPALLPQV